MTCDPPSLGPAPWTERYPELRASVFVVTYGRSGSTLLQNLLNALPGYLIRGENDNLTAPLARAWDTVRRSPQKAEMQNRPLPTSPSDPWFGYEDVAAGALGAGLAGTFAETVLRPAAETRVTGFKEIRWHADPALFPVQLDFLAAFFPRARFVFNIRDHDEVVRSGWWKHMDPAKVRAQLERAEALYAAYAGRNPAACLTMDYGRYTQGPAAWRPLFDFLEEPFAPEPVAAALGRRLTHLHNA